MGGQLRLQGLLLPAQAPLLRRQGVEGPGELLQLLPAGLHLGKLSLQLWNAAHALVHLPPVEPLLQTPLRLGVGHVLLPGGHQSGDAPLQLRGRLDGQRAALPQKGGALKHLPAHPQQQLPAVGPGQAGDGLLGAGIHRLKGPEGGVPLGGAADGDVPPLPLQGDLPLHGGAGPGLVPVLVRQVPLLVPVPGVDAIEHGLQKGGPGGLAPLVGGLDQVEAGGELQSLSRQLAKDRRHGFDLHGAISSPFSRAARPKRTAC